MLVAASLVMRQEWCKIRYENDAEKSSATSQIEKFKLGVTDNCSELVRTSVFLLNDMRDICGGYLTPHKGKHLISCNGILCVKTVASQLLIKVIDPNWIQISFISLVGGVGLPLGLPVTVLRIPYWL